MIRFLHAADLHLDSPFRSLTPEKAAQRRAELRQLPQQLCELAQQQRCELLLLAGDLFDAVGGYPESTEALQRAFRAFPGEVFIAPGNHDFYSAASPYAAGGWSENVHIFRSAQPERVFLPTFDCAVYGAAFQEESAPALLEGFRVEDPDCINLMVLHGDALNAQSPYNPISQAQIEASGLDYLALGHVHACSGPQQAGGTVYAWPGCTAGRGFDETGEKGVLLGEVSGGLCTIRFQPLPSRRYEILRLAAGEDPLAAILSALPEDTQRDSYRIILTGEADPPDLRALYTALEPRFFSLTLRDQTRPKAELWAAAGEDTLKGLFLQRLKEEWDTAPEAERKRIALAARYGLAALEGREVPEL